jgi:arylsulfatase
MHVLSGTLCLAACHSDKGAIAAEAATPAGPELSGSRPNIILIVTDDQGYGDLGRHGNPILQTPHLDRLYDESLRFTDFHVSPTCAPTRSALMTGRHEFKSGVTHTIQERERMSLRATTVAEILKSAGYATGIFGKWHLGDEEAYRPDQRGFDETFIHGAGGIGQTFPGSCGDAPNNSYFDPVILHNGVFQKTQGYCTDVFFSQALDWMEKTKDGGPFFCYITPNAPHAPLDVPARYEEMYAGQVSKPEIAKFFGMITNIDENVGRLVEKLDEWGIARSTLLVFMNDNGGTVGCQVYNAGMRGSKVGAHNGGTRAISLWRWPGKIEPASTAALTAHLDLFPTFAELAGAEIPDEWQRTLEGHSLVPLLNNPREEPTWQDERMLFTHVGRWGQGVAPVKFGACSVRWRQYLLVREKDAWTLFDLQNDPGETIDIVSQQADVAARLSSAYDQWWQETLPYLENESAYQTAPAINPFKELYWKQYAGPGPNNAPPP